MDSMPHDKTSFSKDLAHLSPIAAQFIAKLEKLSELKAEGTLSEIEFNQRKCEALAQWKPTLDKAELEADRFIRNIHRTIFNISEPPKTPLSSKGEEWAHSIERQNATQPASVNS